MLTSYKMHLRQNTIAFFSVFVAAYAMTLFGSYEIEMGSLIYLPYYIYLPLGAKILMYLLFGFSVFPGIIISCVVTGVVLFNSWNDHLLIGTLAACAGASAPIIVMIVMKLLNICNFNNLKNIDFKNILLLIIFTSMASATLKFFVYTQGTIDLGVIDFIAHYITGDIFGSLIVIYFVLKVIAPILVRISHMNSIAKS